MFDHNLLAVTLPEAGVHGAVPAPAQHGPHLVVLLQGARAVGAGPQHSGPRHSRPAGPLAAG